MHAFRFEALELPPEAVALRRRARDFLAGERERGGFASHRTSWSSFDADFSRRAGAAGFIGLTWSPEYGGHGRTNLERFVVAEEMLAAGAPAGAHWIADRQSGPQIVRYASERAKRLVLPRIAAGECYFGIGMSEPDSGSDLAAVRTRAEKVDGGWVVNGAKIWTSNAHRVHYIIALVRTGPAGDSRHAGLSQLIVDMASPGIEVRPILNIAGAHEFNEVFFKDCFVPDDMLLGEAGSGWTSVTGELAHERAGPDRFMSDIRVLVELIDHIGHEPDARQAVEIGRLVAHFATLRRMSTSIAGLLERGESPATEAALVKDVGTAFERELPEVARRIAPVEPSPDDQGNLFAEAMAHVTLQAPSFTIRGGTPEILRGMIAPRPGASLMSVQAADAGGLADLLLDQADRLFTQHAGREVLAAADRGTWPEALWGAVEAAGFGLARVSEESGGVGLGAREAGLLVRRSAYHTVPIPLAETILANALWTEAGGDALAGPATLAPTNAGDRLVLRPSFRGGFTLAGTAGRVPWGAQAAHILLLASDGAGAGHLCLVAGGRAAAAPIRNLAGEPRDTLVLGDLALPADAVRPAGGLSSDDLMAHGAAMRSQQLAGGMARCLDYALAYANERSQFGRPLAKFQAIQHMLAVAAGQLAAATAAADAVLETTGGDAFSFAAAVAKARTGEAAGQVAAICHQVHAAMGFTQEHPLHFATRRLWSWRDEFGSESVWQARLGRLVCARGGEALWTTVTGEWAA